MTLAMDALPEMLPPADESLPALNTPPIVDAAVPTADAAVDTAVFMLIVRAKPSPPLIGRSPLAATRSRDACDGDH